MRNHSVAHTFSVMSRAFTKEPDEGEAVEDLPDRPISEHPNLVTAQGLAQIEDGTACRKADEFAARFREETNALFRRLDVPWCSYGRDSVLHVSTGAAGCGYLETCDGALCRADAALLKAKRPEDKWLKKALWLEGVDWPGGKQAWTSMTHGEGELRRTVAAFEGAIARLRSAGADLGTR